MRSFKTEGIIIKRRDYGEADRILTVMTREYGKLKINAKGVRKITSRRSAHIELLNYSILHLYKAHSMAVLTEVKMLEDFSPIKENFDKVGLAYHLCELVDGLCPENQENRNVYFLLQKTLFELSRKKEMINSFLPDYVTEGIDDYTLGTFGIDEHDVPVSVNKKHGLLERFEFTLLSELGYWDRQHAFPNQLDTQLMIEDILERKLKSRSIFSKLQ
jgi:recombinational DNA repair protein (RecF pathway)